MDSWASGCSSLRIKWYVCMAPNHGVSFRSCPPSRCWGNSGTMANQPSPTVQISERHEVHYFTPRTCKPCSLGSVHIHQQSTTFGENRRRLAKVHQYHVLGIDSVCRLVNLKLANKCWEKPIFLAPKFFRWRKRKFESENFAGKLLASHLYSYLARSSIDLRIFCCFVWGVLTSPNKKGCFFGSLVLLPCCRHVLAVVLTLFGALLARTGEKDASAS